MKFSQLIGAIEAEIQFEYLHGAINWCDTNFGNAWSRAVDRFDNALSVAIERIDYPLAEKEGEFYKATILSLLSKYKKHKNMDDMDSFLKSIGGLA